MVSIMPTAMDITYCEGARLLQDSQAVLDAILVQRPNGNLTCKHCYLVILADTDPDTDNLQTMSSDKDWPLVVSCHVQACVSLHDRRAAYSCYACLERGKTSIETSVASLKSHLQSCHLIKELQPTTPYQRREPDSPKESRAPSIPQRPKRRSRPTPGVEATPERQTARDPEMVQSPTTRRPVPSNPFWSGQTVPSPVGPNSPATPIKQAPAESERLERPLQSRSRREVPTQAESTYTPSIAPRPEQPNAVNHSLPGGADVFDIPGGFPPHDAASHDPRSPFFQEFPPTPPPRAGTLSNDRSTATIRRKDVRMELNAQAFPEPNREDRSFPTRPSRAPPAPPVLSAPAAGPNSPAVAAAAAAAYSIQGDMSPFQNPLTSDMNASADSAKIRQLAALGISRAKAEYLLTQTGGDVNEAAELGFSEQQGGMAGSAGEWLPTPSSQAAQAEGLPASSGTDRRNRRSR